MSGVCLRCRTTTAWESNQEPADLSKFGKALTAGYMPNLAIIDCTASDRPPAHYLEWMQEGINIITPNKKLGSGPLDQYQAVKKVQRESYIHFFYEVSTDWMSRHHRLA
jgi:aspartokinase/homoserine dehydrogenase 1